MSYIIHLLNKYFCPSNSMRWFLSYSISQKKKKEQKVLTIILSLDILFIDFKITTFLITSPRFLIWTILNISFLFCLNEAFLELNYSLHSVNKQIQLKFKSQWSNLWIYSNLKFVKQNNFSFWYQICIVNFQWNSKEPVNQ